MKIKLLAITALLLAQLACGIVEVMKPATGREYRKPVPQHVSPAMLGEMGTGGK